MVLAVLEFAKNVGMVIFFFGMPARTSWIDATIALAFIDNILILVSGWVARWWGPRVSRCSGPVPGCSSIACTSAHMCAPPPVAADGRVSRVQALEHVEGRDGRRWLRSLRGVQWLRSVHTPGRSS